jgi:hypothetical protein
LLRRISAKIQVSTCGVVSYLRKLLVRERGKAAVRFAVPFHPTLWKLRFHTNLSFRSIWPQFVRLSSFDIPNSGTNHFSNVSDGHSHGHCRHFAVHSSIDAPQVATTKARTVQAAVGACEGMQSKQRSQTYATSCGKSGRPDEINAGTTSGSAPVFRARPRESRECSCRFGA